MLKKLLFLVLLLLIARYMSTQELKLKIIKSFYAFDIWGNEKKIYLVEYDIYKGFGIDNVYFLAEKHKFELTKKNDRIGYLWLVFVRGTGEKMLFLEKPIWALTAYDYQTGYVTYSFILDLYSQSTVNNYFLEFQRKELE
jgi:hypothetical protein